MRTLGCLIDSKSGRQPGHQGLETQQDPGQSSLHICLLLPALRAIHPASILCISVHLFLVLPSSVSGYYNEPYTISNPNFQKKSDWPSSDPMPIPGPNNVAKGIGSYHIKMTTKAHTPTRGQMHRQGWQ